MLISYSEFDVGSTVFLNSLSWLLLCFFLILLINDNDYIHHGELYVYMTHLSPFYVHFPSQASLLSSLFHECPHSLLSHPKELGVRCHSGTVQAFVKSRLFSFFSVFAFHLRCSSPRDSRAVLPRQSLPVLTPLLDAVCQYHGYC